MSLLLLLLLLFLLLLLLLLLLLWAVVFVVYAYDSLISKFPSCIIGMGRASMIIPERQHKEPKSLPSAVIGIMSP